MSLKQFIKQKKLLEMVEDDFGEFWVVTKGTNHSEELDILFKSDVKGMMRQALGGLKEDDVIYIGNNEAKAKEIAQQVMSNLKSGDEEHLMRYD